MFTFVTKSNIMISRIQEVMKNNNLSPSQFADEINVQRSGISHILSGRNKPSLEFILKVLTRFPDVNASWLLFGKHEQEELKYRKTPDPDIKINGNTELFPIEKGLMEEISVPEENQEKKEKSIDSTQKPEEEILEKVLFFYRDKTFKEYKPENK